MTPQDPIDDDEPVEQAPAPDAIALRHPAAAVTIEQLAALGVEPALVIIRARDQIIRTARKASLAMTAASDWLLFQRPDGVVTAYLQDVGAARVRPLWGIHVTNISKPEKINGAEPDDFAYWLTGDGYSTLTGGTVEAIEGARGSREDFVKGKVGVELDKDVRRAARANLNGSITRELAGLGAIPVDELIDAWKGSTKSIEHCARGRGFGSRDERLGGVLAPDAGLESPVCRVCKQPMNLKKGSKGYFYSCRDYKAHGRDAVTWDLDKWKAE